MKICLIHGKRIASEVVVRALASGLNAEVVHFSSCESALSSSLLDYDVFIVYNNFRRKMSGIQGVQEIESLNPEALIIGVSSNPSFYQRFLSSGADVAVLRAGNEIGELRKIIQQKMAKCS